MKINKGKKLDKLLKLERELTYQFDSDVRVAMTLLEVIRKLNKKLNNEYKKKEDN